MHHWLCTQCYTTESNLCPFLPPMHRSCYTIPPTWPPLSPTLHPVCSQPHQVSRLAAPEVMASLLYSSVNDASFHACYNLHYQSLCHCCNFQSILLIFLSFVEPEWLHETSFSLSKTLPLSTMYSCTQVTTCMHNRSIPRDSTHTGVCTVRGGMHGLGLRLASCVGS